MKPRIRSIARVGTAWLCVALLAPTAFAATERDAQRQRIAVERAAAQTRYAERERACQGRFVVTSCVDAARQEQRATLARLRHEELALDDAQRHEAAAERRRALADKAASDAERAQADAVAPRSERIRRPPTPHPAAKTGTGSAAKPMESADERRAAEQRSQREFEARARAAQAHREAVEQRNAQRASKGKVAAPLPVPSGASAP